jgi:rubrerythrin
MAALTENEDIRKVLLDIAKEEKTHMGEFETLLLMKDEEQKEELKEGEEEVEELLGK